MLDGVRRELDRVHIDAGAGTADVDGGTDDVGRAHRFRDAGDQDAIGRREAFVYQGGEAADEGNADGFGGFVQRLSHAHIAIRPGRGGDLRDRCDGNALVDDGHAVFGGKRRSSRDQVFADAGDFVVDIAVERVDIGRDAVVQVNADGDGAHIKVLLGYHADGFEDFVAVEIAHGDNCDEWCGILRRLFCADVFAPNIARFYCL